MEKEIQQLRETAIAAEAQQRLRYQLIASQRIALYNFAPKYCPYCGHTFEWDQVSINDFGARNSFGCPGCNIRFQKVNGFDLLQAAQDAGGDLVEMLERFVL